MVFSAQCADLTNVIVASIPIVHVIKYVCTLLTTWHWGKFTNSTNMFLFSFFFIQHLNMGLPKSNGPGRFFYKAQQGQWGDSKICLEYQTFWSLISLAPDPWNGVWGRCIHGFSSSAWNAKLHLLVHILPLIVTDIHCQVSSVCRRCITLSI